MTSYTYSQFNSLLRQNSFDEAKIKELWPQYQRGTIKCEYRAKTKPRPTRHPLKRVRLNHIPTGDRFVCSVSKKEAFADGATKMILYIPQDRFMQIPCQQYRFKKDTAITIGEVLNLISSFYGRRMPRQDLKTYLQYFQPDDFNYSREIASKALVAMQENAKQAPPHFIELMSSLTFFEGFTIRTDHKGWKHVYLRLGS